MLAIKQPLGGDTGNPTHRTVNLKTDDLLLSKLRENNNLPGESELSQTRMVQGSQLN